MSGAWVAHRYGSGETLDLGGGIVGAIVWSQIRGQGFEARVEGFPPKVIGNDAAAARRWVQRALRKKLTDALAKLDALEKTDA